MNKKKHTTKHRHTVPNSKLLNEALVAKLIEKVDGSSNPWANFLDAHGTERGERPAGAVRER